MTWNHIEVWQCSQCPSQCIVFQEHCGEVEKPHHCLYNWGSSDNQETLDALWLDVSNKYQISQTGD